MQGKKIALLTLQHFANAPRAQKEAGSLARAGAKVTVYGNWWNDERAGEDTQLARDLGVQFIPLIDYRSSSFAARLKGRIAREALKRSGLVLPEAFGVSARAMLREITRLQPDLTMTHCEPGLWAGRKLIQAGFKVGIDFEDWFSKDLLPEAHKERPVAALAEAEKFMLQHAAVSFTTTESMATALAQWAGINKTPTVIPNCFPWADAPKENDNADQRDPDCISFYWFSQTIGPGRGLEILGQALTQVSGNWQLHLRGNLNNRQAWFEQTFPESIRDRILIHPPVANKDLPRHSASHDVGLALEIPYCKNKDLTASNKVFEYLRCGLAVIATDTSGQREVIERCPKAGWLLPAEDLDALTKRLQACLSNPSGLTEAKDHAAQAAAGPWAWESYEESLVRNVEAAL
ncbi:glycosyltransferase [Akkermansiaceae bacterium]|nr:glycosyltransferase [Akkermansiaceae bacterium]